MSNKSWNATIFSKKAFLLIILIILVIIPISLAFFENFNSLNINISQEKNLSTNSIKRENYSEILTEAKHGLGNITIDDIDFASFRLGFFNENVNHPLIIEDIVNRTLELSTTNLEFMETTSPAMKNNLDNEKDKITVTIKLNETIHVAYNHSEARYLVYHSRYLGARLMNFYVNNGSTITKLTENEDFTIDDSQFLIFYYEDYFKQGREFNFDMYLIWEYDLGIGDWILEQKEEEFLEITEIEQEITSTFHYSFFLIGWEHAIQIEEKIPINYWSVSMIVKPLDKEQFNNHKLMLNGIEVDIGEHLTPNKSLEIKVSDAFTPESSIFSLNFTTTYVLKFDEPVGNFWAVDRLVEQRSIRERIYIPSLISGPRHIYLRNVIFVDPAIYFGEVIDAYTLFDREVLYYDINASIYDRIGLNITIPYLYVGESCPLSIKYFTNQKLKVVITDDIKMPLVGAKVEFFHFGALYGTYISNSTSHPIIPRKSDENGIIVIGNVPRGDYTIKVYWQGSLVEEAEISTFKETNYVYTNIPHSPLWIITFGAICAFILILGSIFYIKYQKLR